MEFSTGVLFIQVILLLGFIGFSFKSGLKIFNFFAIGVLISMIPTLKEYMALMIVGIGLILFLLIDTFRRKGEY